jgi:hypothetical protein
LHDADRRARGVIFCTFTLDSVAGRNAIAIHDAIGVRPWAMPFTAEQLACDMAEMS